MNPNDPRRRTIALDMPTYLQFEVHTHIIARVKKDKESKISKMKLILNTLLLIAFSQSSQAAITVTISQTTFGTSFSISQTSPIELFEFGPNHISGMALAPSAIKQEDNLPLFVRSFSPALGAFGSGPFGGVSGEIIGFSYFFDTGTSQYKPFLDFNWFISSGPFSTSDGSQLQLESSATSELSIDFSLFILGSHVSHDPVFGEVTTTVIPEPNSLVLTSIASCLLLLRRRSLEKIRR